MGKLTTETPFAHEINVGNPPHKLVVQFPQFAGVTTLSDKTTVTLTVEQLMGGIINHNAVDTPTTDTFPTAALIIAAMTGVPKANQSFMFSVINTAADTATLTFAAGTNGSIVGLATLASTLSALWLCKVASDTTVVFYRLK